MKLRDSSKLWILMITAFIDMVGMLMVLPLLPFYAKELGQGGTVVGLLVSSFAVAQLITSPLWGRFSDSHGRRPALIVGLSAAAIAYVIFAFALEMGPLALGMLFLSRRNPGVRRRFDRARGACEGTGVAVGRDERRRRHWSGTRLVDGGGMGSARAGTVRRGTLYWQHRVCRPLPP